MAVWFPLGIPIGTNYYVALAGNDANDGLTPANAWQTCTKINTSLFSPGDIINFNGGDNFSGTLTFKFNTNILASNQNLPVTVQSYGLGQATITGNNPGVNTGGHGPRSWCIKIDGINGIVINNLNIAGSGYVLGSATQYGVFITNTKSVFCHNITVKNCNISGFTVVGVPADFSGEVFVDGFPGSGNGGLDQINVINNNLFGAIGVTSTDDGAINGFGLNRNITNTVYQGNLCYNLGGQTPATLGIGHSGVSGNTTQFNILHDIGANGTTCGGSAAIEPFAATNVIIQFNEVYKIRPLNNIYPGTGCDWDAIDIDGGCSFVTVQYNYAHDNFGTGYLMFSETVFGFTWHDNTIRYNISENDGQGGFSLGLSATYYASFAGTGGPFYLYNNTIYMSLGTSPVGFRTGGAAPTGITSIIANNIFYVGQSSGGTFSGSTVFSNFNTLPGTNITFLANCWYTLGSNPKWTGIGAGNTVLTTLADWQAVVTGADAGAITSDPKLANPGSGGVLSWNPRTQTSAAWPPSGGPSGYQLTTGSPCIGTGVDLTQAPYSLNVGTRDYFGNTIPHGVGTGYNMGADGGIHP